MPGFLEFIPLFTENADTIRARINADANAGLSPDDPAFLDLTEGGFFYDVTQAPVLEAERMWDAIGTELPMAVFVTFAWGIYLDEHGVTINLPRKPAAPASGLVTFTGDPGTVIAAGTQVSTVQTDPTADPLTFEVIAPGGTIPGPGILILEVTAVEVGSAWNVPAGSISVLSSVVSGIVESLTNPASMSGGADVESDEAYRRRLLLAYAGARGAGTTADYEAWALGYPGVGFATVTPIWDGPGTVKVVITDESNNPVGPSVVQGLQDLLDPVPAMGMGLAPIGATVTVSTPTVVTVNVTAVLTFATGYSLDGSSGTVALEDDIIESIRRYIDSLVPAADVVSQAIVAAIMAVAGVADTADPIINGVAANLTIGLDQVAQSGTIALSD